MKQAKIIFITTLLISGFYSIPVYSQEIRPFGYDKILTQKNDPIVYGKGKKGFTGASFRFYKKYISSQDANSCTFHPSCSEYATLVIAKKGFFLGGMLTFDRLSRCNGLSPEKYKIDKRTNLMIDNVE